MIGWKSVIPGGTLVLFTLVGCEPTVFSGEKDSRFTGSSIILVEKKLEVGDSPKGTRHVKQEKAVNSSHEKSETRAAQASSLEVSHSDEEWRKLLTPKQYSVLREGETEAPFTGKYYKLNEKGVYTCAACGAELFTSEEKFDAGCGWPSFWAPVKDGRIATRTDTSHGMIRTEILCARCGSHLGHVFEDGPQPTGLRYCVNSAALEHEATSSQ